MCCVGVFETGIARMDELTGERGEKYISTGRPTSVDDAAIIMLALNRWPSVRSASSPP